MTGELSEELEARLDTLFIGEERLSVAEIRRRAVAGDMDANVLLCIDALPEGEYAQDEVLVVTGSVPGLSRTEGNEAVE
ncbi:hypothetical protein, partial [Catellatospora sp. NPDC049609]|uniref:hypothetical protein n=1 Tax=Catellatospora sp. NPDC049609 TaxID=3155505 RepID=UPI003447AF43